MGIQDRDYYRDGPGFLDAWARQGVVVWIIVITVIVFILQNATAERGNVWLSSITQAGAYYGPAILQGEVWRLVTPLLLHETIWHILFNMLGLYFLGTWLEEVYGGREFLLIYLLAGVGASTFVLGAEGLGHPNVLSIGASGAVSALIVLFVFHFPRAQLLLFGVIPMRAWVLGVAFLVVNVSGAVTPGRSKIDYMAHLGGAVFGLLYYHSGIRFAGLFTRPRRGAERRARPRLRVVPAESDTNTPTPVGAAVESPPKPKESKDERPSQEDLEARVDAVLAKVSKDGQDSLTPEEREILFKASEIYKKRRK